MMTSGTVLSTYDDIPCDDLQRCADIPRLVILDRCVSTMDVAHQLAQVGAVHGTAVVANQQDAGRGRSGKVWDSARGQGVWVSVVLRGPTTTSTGVLSLRAGLELACALGMRTAAPIQLKWPNDLFLSERKLAGILTEARWRGDALEWIVVGVGVNVGATDGEPVAAVASLASLVRRSDVLIDVLASVLRAAQPTGDLTDDELARFAARDLAVGRAVDAPLVGTVVGITARGGVRIRTVAGDSVAVAGSLVFRSPLAE